MNFTTETNSNKGFKTLRELATEKLAVAAAEDIHDNGDDENPTYDKNDDHDNDSDDNDLDDENPKLP